MKEIKSVFFRIIFNLPLGFLFLKILGDFNPQLCLNQIDMKSIFGTSCFNSLPGWFWAMLYLSILLLAGEIVSILGEWLTNWIFDFPAFWNKGETNSKNNFEKPMPFEKILPGEKSYITNKMLVVTLNSNGDIGDFSEMHFALSRLLAGAAWLCLFLLINTVWWLMLLIVILIIFTIPLLIYFTKRNWASFCMLLLSLVLILIFALSKYLNCADLMWPILTGILTIILLFASCIYRSVANVINYSACDTNSQKKESEKHVELKRPIGFWNKVKNFFGI